MLDVSNFNEYIDLLKARFPSFASFNSHLKTIFNSRNQKVVRNKDNLQSRHAAVLFSLIIPEQIMDYEVVTDQNGSFMTDIHLLLEKRSLKLKQNPGDVSFPGGTQDPDDKSIIETAYREAYEELGVDLKSLSYISNMDEFVSTSGLVVYPIISWLKVNVDRQEMITSIKNMHYPRTMETEETIVVPLLYLINPKYYFSMEYQIEKKHTASTTGYVRYFNISKFNTNTSIWGLTASIIRRFIDTVFPDNPLPIEPTS